MMRKAISTLVALFAAVLVALGGASAAKAERAVHLQGLFDRSGSFVDPFFSDQCGFPVTVSFTISGDVTLVYNDAGLVVKEVDTSPDSKVTYSSEFGSFTYPAQLTLVTTYPGGATLGSTANLIFSGVLFRVTGAQKPSAGVSISKNAVVVGFTPQGIPEVDFTGTTTSTFHGTPVSFDQFVTATCAALSPWRHDLEPRLYPALFAVIEPEGVAAVGRPPLLPPVEPGPRPAPSARARLREPEPRELLGRRLSAHQVPALERPLEDRVGVALRGRACSSPGAERLKEV